MQEHREFLRSVIRHQRITKAELARVAGVTASAVSKFLGGQNTLAADKLAKMAPEIGVNPKFLTGEQRNPFASNRLIKMLLSDSLVVGVDYEMLYYIAAANERLNIAFLFSQSSMIQRVLKGTVFENPVAAIACKDADGNMFLFRRRNGYPIIGERGLELKLQENREAGQIMTARKRVSDAVYRRIKDWSAKREDFEELFPDDNESLTSDEWWLLRLLRAKNIDPKKAWEIIEFTSLTTK